MMDDVKKNCGSPDHLMHRRRFLEGLSAGALSTFSWSGLFSNPAFSATAKKKQKHCILLWLCGGPSQFETWDPKPGSRACQRANTNSVLQFVKDQANPR